MAQNLLLALQITAIGMGLVFGSIILFWLLMAAMVRVTNAGLVKKQNHKGHKGHKGLVDEGRPQEEGGHPRGEGRPRGGAPTQYGQPQEEGGHPHGGAPTEEGLRRRAAAAAVAVALARRGGAAGWATRAASPTGQASAWQVVQRAKSLRIFPRGRAR